MPGLPEPWQFKPFAFDVPFTMKEDVWMCSLSNSGSLWKLRKMSKESCEQFKAEKK